MRLLRGFLAAALASLMVASSGQETPETVTLRIRVIDTHGQPIPNAQVFLLDLKRRTPDGSPLKTDAEGVLEIPDIPPGQVRLNIDADEYCDLVDQQILVSRAQPVHEATLELTGVCRIFGKVTAGPEIPPPTGNIIVCLRVSGAPRGGWRVKLDADGSFTLAIRDFDVREVWVRAEGSSWVKREVEPEPDKIIDDLEFVLQEPSGSLAGEVAGADGKPVSEPYVGLLCEDVVKAQGDGVWDYPAFWHAENERQKTRADEQGQFRLDDLPAGRYYLSAGDADEEHRGHIGPIEVKPGEETAGLVVPYDTSVEGKRATFAGTLLGVDGRPLPDHPFVYSYTAIETFEGRRVSFGQGPGQEEGRSEGDGRFTIPTKYTCDRGSLSVWGEGVLPFAIMWAEPDDQRLIDADSIPKRGVSGAVYRGPGREPLSGAELILVGRADKHRGTQDVRVQTDADGHFGPVMLDRRATELQVLKPGRDSTGISRATFALPPGEEPAEIEAVFGDLGSVEGTVTQNGQPLDVPVTVRVGSSWQALAPSRFGSPPVRGLHAVLPAGQTDWRFDDLEPDTYVFQAEGTGLFFGPGVQVEVKPGETVHESIEVPKATTIAGRVIGTDGKVPPEAYLSLCPGWTVPPAWVEFPVGADGRFSFENMPATRMRFTVRAEGYDRETRALDVPEKGIANLEFKLEPTK